MNHDVERNEMIETIKRIATEIGSRHVARNEFRRRSGVSERKMQLLFGSYNALAEAAGLETRAFPEADTPQYTDEELLQEIVRVLRLPASKMTRIFFEQHGNVSYSVCERRFGGWIGALRRASRLLDSDKDAELLGRLDEYTETRVRADSQQAKAAHCDPSVDEGDSAGPKAAIPASVIHRPVPAEASPNIFGDFITNLAAI